MRIRVAVENGNDGRSLAWALDYPGCFIYGRDESEVILSLPRAYLQYRDWIARHENTTPPTASSLDIQLVEVWQCYSVGKEYQIAESGIAINAWFRDDWRILTSQEVSHARMLLGWSRADLLELVHSLSRKDLSRCLRGVEQWPITRILQHIANAEWWYLDRLNLAPCKKEELPEDLLNRLGIVRSRVEEALGDLAGRDMVIGKEGEFWSPRKLIRRLLYHEHDHHGHILQILAEPS